MMEGGRPPISPEQEDDDRILVEAYNTLGPIRAMPERGENPTPEVLAERQRIHEINEPRQRAAWVINEELKELSRKLAGREQINDQVREEIKNNYLKRLVNAPPGESPERRATTASAVRGMLYNAMKNGWRDHLRQRSTTDDGKTRRRTVPIEDLKEKKGGGWVNDISAADPREPEPDALELLQASRNIERLPDLTRTSIQQIADGMGDRAAESFANTMKERHALFEGTLIMEELVDAEMAADPDQSTRKTVTNRIQKRHSIALKRLWDETENRCIRGKITPDEATIMRAYIGMLRLRKSDKDA